ncbi:MAG: hypothetical protein J6R16_04890 [Alistipes sp.]|nr:hypothetical protein [Alistipes sp.]
MKQNLLISIYQVVAVALCTLIIANIGLDAELLRITAYIVAAMLALNILVITLCWKRFGLALRFRITEAILLIASAFTPLVSYYTFIGDNTVLPVATSKLILLYAMGQVSWCLAVYILPDLVGKLREKRY